MQKQSEENRLESLSKPQNGNGVSCESILHALNSVIVLICFTNNIPHIFPHSKVWSGTWPWQTFLNIKKCSKVTQLRESYLSTTRSILNVWILGISTHHLRSINYSHIFFSYIWAVQFSIIVSWKSLEWLHGFYTF